MRTNVRRPPSRQAALSRPTLEHLGLDRLVETAQAGDQEAFSELVQRTSSQVYSLCLRLSGNEHDARDIMQETYLRVFRSLGGFRGQSSITTWIYRIAANCASTHLSKRRRRTQRALDFDVEVHGNLPALGRDGDPELVSEASEERKRLATALQRLPFSLRSVVVLRDVYDLTHEEIAAELKISRAAVKVRLHRGRRRLHDALFGSPVSGDQVAPTDVAETEDPHLTYERGETLVAGGTGG